MADQPTIQGTVSIIPQPEEAPVSENPEQVSETPIQPDEDVNDFIFNLDNLSKIPEKPKNFTIFSYQGAFGPPTFGHFFAMFEFAKKILSNPEYSNGKILMLFMPTPGGSKSHLFPTQNTRVRCLAKFCEILEDKFNIPTLMFNVSTIEYELAKKNDVSGIGNKSVATFETINALSPKCSNLLLGMGMDNAIGLPSWSRSSEYKNYVKEIYIVKRDNTPEINGEGFPKITQLESEIPPTSSSMLRHYIGPAKVGIQESVEKVNKIITGDTINMGDGLIDQIIYFTPSEANPSQLDQEKYENEYSVFLSSLPKFIEEYKMYSQSTASTGGKRRKSRKTRKSKKTRKSRKTRKSKKTRKSRKGKMSYRK
jgi:nicotinic acid mononucleotide adenylyltransferase